jgi:hypothetical protein
LAVVIAGLATAHAARAQEAESVTVDVGECTTLQSPEERLACYEAHVAAELGKRDAATQAAGPDTAAAAEPPARATSTSSAGAAQPTAAPDEEPREIVGTVASVRETIPNTYVITLEDGQVWRQTYPEKYPVRAGHRVTIRPTRWGSSFRLSAESVHGSIQVERVR